MKEISALISAALMAAFLLPLISTGHQSLSSFSAHRQFALTRMTNGGIDWP